MKQLSLSRALFLCSVLAVRSDVAQGKSFESLQEAIIKDNMPESSSKCNPRGSDSTSSSFTFTSSQEESKWFQGYPESSFYGAPWSNHEQHVFNAQMSHTDPNSSDRSWKMRIGTGGNIYSLVGPMGETVAPQKRADSPWIDEVWHSVGVDPPRNQQEPFMIHGAGSYQYDQTYSETEGVPLTKVPFYAPSLGKYCNVEEGECGFAAWAQHGPVPVSWKSEMLNFNRYINCGNGVIEHTIVSHNNVRNEYALNRIDAPFGAIRMTTLRDIVISDSTSEIVIKQHDLGNYATEAATKIPGKDTLGYAIFAEDLPSPVTGRYPLKNGVEFKIHNIGCRNYGALAWPAVMCRLEPTVEDLSGTRTPITLRGTPPTLEPLCSTTNASNCITAFKFIKYGSNNYCRAFGAGVSCRLDNNFLNNFQNSGGNGASIKFQTDTGRSFTASNGVTYWAFQFNGIYSLIFTPVAGVDPTLAEIEAMVSANADAGNAQWNISLNLSNDVGGDIHARNGVYNWVNHIEQTGAYWTYFYADEVDGESDLAAYFNRKFPAGTTIEILYHEGKPEEENLSMAHVYGNSFGAQWQSKWPLLWVGNANEGSRPRDLNVYNIVTTSSRMTGGGSHVYRQYFVMDRFNNISTTAASFVSEAMQKEYNVNNDGDSNPVGRSVHLYHRKGNNIGAVVGEFTGTSICTGSTTPKKDFKALFEIKCGDSYYIGQDLYYWAPVETNKKRAYICKNDNTARGVWTLLGFFPEASCSSIELGYVFDGSKDVSLPTDAPSDQPSGLPTTVPTDTPSGQPSDLPTIVPSSIPSIFPTVAKSNKPSEFLSEMPSESPTSMLSAYPSTPSNICEDVPNFTWTFKDRERTCSFISTDPDKLEARRQKFCFESNGETIAAVGFGCSKTCDLCGATNVPSATVTLPPTSSPVAAGQCSDQNQLKMELHLTLDNGVNQNAVIVQNKGTNKRVFKLGTSEFDTANKSYQWFKCLDSNQCYRFKIVDKGKDGFTDGSGTYTLKWDGIEVQVSQFDGTAGNLGREIVKFGTC